MRRPVHGESGAHGRIKPLLSGQYADKIGSKFTGMYRQRTVTEPNKPTQYVWDVLPPEPSIPTTPSALSSKPFPASYESMMKYWQRFPPVPNQPVA